VTVSEDDVAGLAMANTPAEIDVLEIIGDTVLLLDGQWRYVYVNRAAERVAGKLREELIGRVIWETYPALIGSPIGAAYRKAMAERAIVRLEAVGVVSERWYDIHVYPAKDGLLIYGRDVSARKQVELALQQSEERFRAQYEGMPVPTYTWRRVPGPEGEPTRFTLIAFNAAAESITRGVVKTLIGVDAKELYRDTPEILDALRESYERRAVCRRDMAYQMRSTGEVKDMFITFAFVPPDLVMVHTEDVTDRRRAERALNELNATLERRVEEQTSALLARSHEIEAAEAQLRRSEEHYRELAEHNRRLARELEHRVGNHLAGLVALVREMRQRGADAEHLARAMEDRLVALAHVHRLLTVENWGPVQVRTLADSLFQALRPAAPHPCPATVEGPDVAVDSNQATALAMILTEWFTNSCKYGVHSKLGGHVEVRWALVGGVSGASERMPADGPWVRLSWMERGGPPIFNHPSPSLGTELVHGFAARELRGRSEMTFPRDGAEHWLEFPTAGTMNGTGEEASSIDRPI
jgi:PAS domain S-box-containing protein